MSILLILPSEPHDHDWDRGTPRWSDLDPAVQTFDYDRAVDVATAACAKHRRSKRLERRHDQTDTLALEITNAFAEQFGPWALGCQLRGARTFSQLAEGTRSLSYLPRVLGDAAARVLRERRGWLETLASRFAALAAIERGTGDAIESAIQGLIVLAIVSDHIDNWPGACRETLRWYLESQGVEPAVASRQVWQAMAGGYDEWLGPNAVDTGRVARRLVGSDEPTLGDIGFAAQHGTPRGSWRCRT